MQPQHWQRFLGRFESFGRQPTVGKYLDLFDPEGTVLHPGMPKPLAGGEIEMFISSALTGMSDFRLHPIRWCARDDTLFVEARCSGTVGGQHAVWPAIYCVTLRDDRVRRGRSYYDRAAVFSHVDPDLAGRRGEAHANVLTDAHLADGEMNGMHLDDAAIRSRLVEAYVASWQAPRPERFAEFYVAGGRLLVPGEPEAWRRHEIAAWYRTLLGEIRDLRQQCEIWAHRPGLLFVEWRTSGRVDGGAFEFGSADRFSLEGDRVVEGVTYFDTLTLRAAGRPENARRTVFAARD